MTKLNWTYQKVVRPIIACLTVFILVITSIYLLGELAPAQSWFEENLWVGYVWGLVTLFWMIYVSIWGLKGLRKRSK